jgi:HAD superfamily hydrolase (TIGR01484 family)
VTGRHHDLAIDGIREHRLPAPELLVCDVGTSVYRAVESGFALDPAYRELMVDALDGADLRSVRARLMELDTLTLQEEGRQSEFKLSYYTPVGPRGEEVARQVRDRLEELGRFSVVHSVDHIAQRGLLDVLPSGIAKDSAVRYLHDSSGVREDQLVYAGDSGNDRAAMLSGFNVVVVGNATPQLKESIRAGASRLALSDRIYFAEAPFAAGVVEGCRHFGLA